MNENEETKFDGSTSDHIFLVDDDNFLTEQHRLMLEHWGYETSTFNCGEDAVAAIESGRRPAVMLLDLIMPGMGGIETLKKIRRLDSDMPVIIVSGQERVATAVEALQEGAYDYMVKPLDKDRLNQVLRHALSQRRLSLQLALLREEVRQNYRLDRLIGRAKEMMEVFRLVEKTLFNDITVLIEGESGTGKELVARAIHYNGQRAGKPLIVVNCAAIPRELVESELFGHEKGAFTGAIQRKLGKFELANSGTLFLDEIGELEAPIQAKLLRALQEQEVERVGGTQPIKVDVRLVAATKRRLQEEVDAGRFREDLYYRVNTFPIPLPALRSRSGDIELLAHHFLEKHSKHLGKENIYGFTDKCLQALNEYEWPGNVRQLENVVTRSMVMTENDQIGVDDLPLDVKGDFEEDVIFETNANGEMVPVESSKDETGSLKFKSPEEIPTLETIKSWAIKEAYHTCKGNISLASKKLQVGRATLYRLLEKYGIETDE